MTDTPPSAATEWRRHWTLVLAASAGMSLAALLTSAFGVMLAPMEEDLGWSRTEISSGPFVVSMMGLVLASPAGFLIDKLGARRCGIMVVLISCTAIASMSAVGDQLWHWQAAWALFGISAAFTSTVWLAPVSTVFNAARGMAIAATIAGLGFSGALVPLIAEYFVQNYGWRTGFLGLAIIWLLLVLPLIVAFVPKMKASPKGDEPVLDTGAAPVELKGLTPREGFRSGSFYLLFFASLVSAMTGVAIVLNLVPVLTFTGLERTDAVWIAGFFGIASIVGRLIGGVLMDRFDVRRLAVIASIISLVFPLSMLILPGVTWAAFVGVLGYGLTGGMKLNAIVYLTTTHLGARSFGLFYGTISITTTVAMGVGPLAANYIYDMTQSYSPVLWAAVPGFLGAGLLFAALGPAPDFTRRR